MRNGIVSNDPLLPENSKLKNDSRRDSTNFSYLCIFATTCYLVLIIAFLGILIYSYPYKTLQRPTPNWQVSYDNWASESCVRLVDINDDGALDVIFAMFWNTFCPDSNVCHGYVMALDGRSGKELWRLKTAYEVFTMECKSIDVNQDGVNDCICNGRKGVLMAINPLNGSLLWECNDKELEKKFNVFQITPVQDLDLDGVPDMVVANGGDQSLGPMALIRAPGRLLLVSGRTGRCIGKHLDMPDGHETYMSPVLYRATDGSDYVLFGSGGETIEGNFMAISLKDLFHKLVSPLPRTPGPGFHGTNDAWKHKRNNDTSIIIIHKSKWKGVMLPPVIADMNLDGVDDMIVSSFDGHVVVYCGKTLNKIWSAAFKGHETYSLPALGYFDDDHYLDLLQHWSFGTFPQYNQSQTVVLSGQNGSVLWKAISQTIQEGSPLVLRTKHKNHDIFIVNIHSLLNSHNGTSEHVLQKRHGIHSEVSCGEDLSHLNSYLYALERNNQHSPRLIDVRPAEKFDYYITREDRLVMRKQYYDRFHEVQPTPNGPYYSGPFCAVLKGVESNAGAIGDVDGDGTLDWVRVQSINAQLKERGGSFVKMKYKLYVKKLNLATILTSVSNSTYFWSHNLLPMTYKFSPYRLQPWTEFMGQQQNAHYRN